MLLLSIQLCPETDVKTKELKGNAAIWGTIEITAFSLWWKLREKINMSSLANQMCFLHFFGKLPLFKYDFGSFRFEYRLELFLIFIVNKQSFQISLIN